LRERTERRHGGWKNDPGEIIADGDNCLCLKTEERKKPGRKSLVAKFPLRVRKAKNLRGLTYRGKTREDKKMGTQRQFNLGPLI